MNDVITSGTLTRMTGLSDKAVRLYRERGLLSPTVDGSGTYRFDVTQLERARDIALLRALGLGLVDVRAILDESGEGRSRALDEKWAALDSTHSNRSALLSYARARLRHDEIPLRDVTIRSEPETLVLSLTISPTIEELAEALARATDALFAVLRSADVPLAGSVFAQYVGVVSSESRGPVEVCVPIVDVVRPAPGMSLRIEPAVTLGVVPLTQAEASYPAIVAVHDQLTRGDGLHGWYVSGFTREIYLPSWGSASSGEIVAEVAVPVAPDSSAPTT